MCVYVEPTIITQKHTAIRPDVPDSDFHLHKFATTSPTNPTNQPTNQRTTSRHQRSSRYNSICVVVRRVNIHTLSPSLLRTMRQEVSQKRNSPRETMETRFFFPAGARRVVIFRVINTAIQLRRLDHRSMRLRRGAGVPPPDRRDFLSEPRSNMRNRAIQLAQTLKSR